MFNISTSIYLSEVMLYVVCIAKEIKNEQIKVFNCLQYVNNLI